MAFVTFGKRALHLIPRAQIKKGIASQKMTKTLHSVRVMKMPMKTTKSVITAGSRSDSVR